MGGEFYELTITVGRRDGPALPSGALSAVANGSILMKEITAVLPVGWMREADRVGDGWVGWNFACFKTHQRKAAVVSLTVDNKGRIVVTSVRPNEPELLTPDEYNGILKEFYESVLKKVDGIEVEMRRPLTERSE